MVRRLRDIGIYLLAILITCGLTLAVVFGFGALVDEVQASGGGEPEPCEVWRKAGTVTVYRCPDDYSDDVCFYADSGMLFCVRN